MSFKKTVTFTARVSDYTDGTVTARVQAENNILGQFVSWLLSNNTSIRQIEKVSIGDAKWSEYPLYAVQSGTPTVVTGFVNGYQLLSDVYVLGKDKNNFLMGICVDNHILNIAPTCSFEFQDSLNAYSARYMSIIAMQLRRTDSSRETTRKRWGGAIYFNTFNTTEDEISMTINYWKSADAIVLHAVGESTRLFFSLDSVDASFGWLSDENGYKCLMNYSFNEPIQADGSTQTLSDHTSSNILDSLAKGYATNANPFFWGRMDSALCYSSSYYCIPAMMHHMNLTDNRVSTYSVNSYLDYMMETDSNYRIECNVTLFNFPRITREQLYLRKMYIPNRQTASPIKLGYTPGNLYADAVYAVNDKNYLCLKNGWCSYFVEVEDQN